MDEPLPCKQEKSVQFRMEARILRGGVMVAREAHNLEIRVQFPSSQLN